jgi:hypothetical protein
MVGTSDVEIVLVFRYVLPVSQSGMDDATLEVSAQAK